MSSSNDDFVESLNSLLEEADSQNGKFAYHQAFQGRPDRGNEIGFVCATTNPAVIGVMKFVADAVDELKKKRGKRPLTRRMTLKQLRKKLATAGELIDVELEMSK